MKIFTRGILTIWITILLIVFGLVINIKSFVVNIADGVIKNELKTNIVEVIENYPNYEIPKESIKEIEKQIDNNQTIKEIINKYYDKVIDVLSSNNSVEINIKEDMKYLLDNSEEILKDYGVTLSSEEKDALLSIVASDEINTIVNDSVNEVKNNLSSDLKMAIDIYNFITSTIFKIILIVLVAIALLLISLLYKNYYGWLFNFGVSAIIVGVFYGMIAPLIFNQTIANLISENKIIISLTTLNIYGYILLSLGIISIIIKILIVKKATTK